MKTIIAITIVLFTYGYHSITTMPAQCFTTKNLVKCNKIQLDLLVDGKSVNWSTVRSLS